jgi:hypothetical protein
MSGSRNDCSAHRPRLLGGIALTLLVALLMTPGTAFAEGGGGGGGGRDFEYPASRPNAMRPNAVRGQMPAARPTMPGRMQGPAAVGSRAPSMQPTGMERAAPGQGYPGRGQRFQTGREGRPMPGRVSRYPGRSGWGAGAVGVGAGILGGILLDQAMRRPAYEYEPEPEPLPRRARRPVIVEDDEIDEPRRPARAAAPPRQPPARTAQPAPPRQPGVVVPPVAERRFVAEEILFELAPGASADAVLRRHRATLIESRRFVLADRTIIRARLDGGRSARTVLAAMAGDARVAGAQPNYLYSLEQQAPAPVEAAASASPAPVAALPAPSSVDPLPAKRELQPQYVADKLRFEAIHKLARGAAIKVAVIDSAADREHRELQGVVAGSFDALGGEAPAHAHGTAMAAAILAQAQLQGVAPSARLLAARAFSGGAPGAANGTTFHILSSLDWAAEQGARVVNLSFAGPQDRLLSQSLAGAKAKGMIAVAAAGNGGAKAAPLYPGADPNVIAVTATDADDKPFAQANRGGYIAVAAPGVDVLAAEPQGRYAFSSGTSIAAAHVSGLVALILEKRPDLDLEGVRKLLMESAVDLGPKGRDPVFGAGRIDPTAALARALPVSAARP